MASHPPSVDALARSLADVALPHSLLVDAARAAIAAGDPGRARAEAEAVAEALLRPVVNATGVLLHTNLGRAPLAVPAARPSTATGGAIRYSNLELDLATGRRGSRQRHAAALLAKAAGAEAALVVNNGAAAVLLALTTLAHAREVIISRGELVEIGGGFRIPEVLAASGAHLVEVGTTNRTTAGDYAAAVSPATAMILKVHQSNYRVVGFAAAATVAELAALGPPVVADIGSGLLDATTPWLPGGPPAWLRQEPAARQSLAEGAALVTFSGDKLLGGPQAGVIAGRRDLVEACARHPLARAVRPGGLVLAALQDTALAYLRRDLAALPFWSLATAPVEGLQRRAAAIGQRVGGAGVRAIDCASVPGGGSLPGMEIPSAGVAVDGDHAAELRRWDPPIVARAHDGDTVCDLRTVDASDDDVLAAALAALSASQPG
ncbi:MAG TPA: L-seryl-tRNA(Sec) selenium transferase [Acidimicrobiales bacterium]|jgi:L-seryl-tRNA(Ser) seleniumtransferase|nr:L-seryl-tRNA(Sec) selenium transferase [Acidimicrobiales bacterium]